jgi:hypothetical protein
MNDHSNHPRPFIGRTVLRSILALLLGLAALRILHTATNQLVHIFVFPEGSPAMALVYGSVYRVLGAYIAARFAPSKPMLHALILGGIELALTAGVAYFLMVLSPFRFVEVDWYWYSWIITALPCAWLGGILHQRFHAPPMDDKPTPGVSETKRKYASTACAWFFSIGVAGLITAGVFVYGLFLEHYFSDKYVSSFLYSSSAVLLGGYSFTAFAFGVILNDRAPEQEKRRGRRKALAILFLSFFLIFLVVLLGGITRFNQQVFEQMLVYAAYGITVMVIAGRCLFVHSTSK